MKPTITIISLTILTTLLGCETERANPQLSFVGTYTQKPDADVQGINGQYSPDTSEDAGTEPDAQVVEPDAGDPPAPDSQVAEPDAGNPSDPDAQVIEPDAGDPSEPDVGDPSDPDAQVVEPGPCVQDADCQDPTVPFCVEGSCVECLNNTQCSNGDQCISNVCTHEGCAADWQCVDPATPHCFLGSCVECLGNAECGVGQVCAYNTCREPPCDTDEQCPEGKVCSQSPDYLCFEPECYSAAECAEGELCVKHECQVPSACNVPGDCPSVFYACIDGICTTSECGNGLECGGETPYCVIQQGLPNVCGECTDNIQCPEGSICDENWTCVALP